jgi:hypothetical protein
MRAKLLREDVAYWTVGDATINGVPVPPHVNLAYKRHWNDPIEIALPEPEDQAMVAEVASPEEPPQAAAIADSAPPPPAIDKVGQPAPSLWQRLFGKRH